MSGTTGTVAGDPAALLRYATAGADLARRVAAEASRLSGLARPAGATAEFGAPLGQLAGSRIPALTRALQETADLAGDVAVRFRRADAARAPWTALPPLPATRADGAGDAAIDAAAWDATLTDIATRLASVGRGTLTVAPQLAARLAEVPMLAPLARLLEGPFGRIAPTAGMLVVGQDLLELLEEGNPREAWRRDGLGYARDVARTVNDTSLLALSVAPSPSTLALAAGSGFVWIDLTCLDNGWPVLLPPPFPTLPDDLEERLQALDERRDLLVPLAGEGFRNLRGLAETGVHDAAGALQAFRSHDLIEGGRRSFDTLAGLATGGTRLVNDVATTGLRVLLSF